MTVSRPTYATREQIKAAANWNGAITDADTDRLAESHSAKVEQLLYRRFYPVIATRYYDWPSLSQVSSTILWLDDDLLTLTTFIASGTTIAQADYILRRNELRPDQPYDRIELDEDSDVSFGDGGQQALSVAGVWGYSQDTEPAGALAAAITDTTGTSVSVTDSGKVGVGDLIKVDSERMIVADKSYVDTTKDINADLDDSSAVVTVSLASSHGILAGETILIDSERMYVEVAAATSLTVRRAVDGSTLAAHTNAASIYAPRTLTVVRGAAGTTAATHLISAAIVRNVSPGLITDLVIAEAIAARTQEGSGYGSTTGPGGQTTPDRIALLDLRKRAMEAYGRDVRVAL